jgi:heat shock protein HslJ
MNIFKTAIFAISIMALMGLSAFAQDGGRNIEIWKPYELNGRHIQVTKAFIEIADGKGRFTGNAGCNTMSGTMTIDNKGIAHFGPVITTKMACKLVEGSMPEGEFLTALDRSTKIRRNGQTLTLYDRRGKVLLKFKASNKHRGDPGDTGLTADKWFLESIGNRKTLVAIKGVFVNFDAEKGSAGGDTGCNVFGGDYTSSKNSISITNIISTMRACEEDGKMTLEREFLDGLKNANRYEISDGRLRLYSNKELLLTLRGEPKKAGTHN